MNRFSLSLQNEDLGITPIENIFINHYLPKAPGDFVKVYLLGLKFCYNNTDSISNQVIAKTLDLLESDVVKAWHYWEEQGIVKIQEQVHQENEIFFLNIKEVVLNKNSFFQSRPPKNTAQKLVDSRKDNNIKQMHNMVEQMYGRPLSSMEMRLYQQWMEEYSFTPEVIILMLEDCFNRGRKESAYIKQVALNWHNSGVKTAADAEKYMVIHREKWERYFKVMSFLGFKRAPTQKEEELLNKWFVKYNFNLEIVLEACAKTAAISQPNFRYIDKIITDWHKKGFTTLEQIQSEQPAATKTYSKKRTTQKSTSKLDSDHNYDLDHLEKKLLKRNRSDSSE